MKRFFSVFALLFSVSLFAEVGEVEFETKTAIDANGYRYEYVEKDPMNSRIYTLKNGLKVYLSDYDEKPRIQTYIAVAAGSKHDPAHATGLAHYLEHILFKGTSNFGTQNWKAEKPYLDSIEAMFNHYATLKDPTERKAYYHLIDSVSNVAAQFAIANEYDKMIAELGGTGTNAYTADERTVYVNDIPSNSIEKWLAVEGERFQEVVPRLFHTELEAVYEEKNRTLDSDMRQAWEKLYAGLYKKHQYGTQTGIGTIEHLKNPSITEIKKFFDHYYRPNNVAICLSGDLNYEKTIQLVDKYFGKWQAKEIEEFKVAKEDPITSVEEIEVYGPQGESVFIGFRMPGQHTQEGALLTVTDMLLSNSGEAGLLNINLGKSQKVIGPWSYPDLSNDYSTHIISATPRQGQDLKDVKDLLLAQLDSIKDGNFKDWLIEAVITELKTDYTKQLGSNSGRANMFVEAFTSGQKWEDALRSFEKLNEITKADVVAFVNKFYTKENYVVVYKRFGEKAAGNSVEKPEITSVPVNRNAMSLFRKGLDVINKEEIEPVFVDFQKDIAFGSTKRKLPVWHKTNTENDLFNLYYMFDMGSLNDPKLAMAVKYLQYLGTKQYSAEAFQLEMYKLGCEFNVFSSKEQLWVSLSGLDQNMEKAMDLFEGLLAGAVPNDAALTNMVLDIEKGREDSKKEKGNILFGGLASYAKYGKDNPFKRNLTSQELKNLTGEELTEKISSLTEYKHMVLYYGPRALVDVETAVDKHHPTKKKLKDVPLAPEFEELSTENPVVYWVNYDMVQAEVMLLSKQESFDAKMAAHIALYNEYFGGGMGAIVFQEMRESRALAYSVYSRYRMAKEAGKANYIQAYIGTQADKLKQAMNDMVDLMYNMPESESSFNDAKMAMISNMRTQRTTKSDVLFQYLAAKERGMETDIRKDVFETAKNIDLKQIVDFQKENVKNRPMTICVIGSKDNLDFESLKQYGELKELSLEEVFGY